MEVRGENLEGQSPTGSVSDGEAEVDALRRMSVPGDGSCLLWAVSMAYLLPVINNLTLFKERFDQLFSVRSTWEVSHVQELLQNDPLEGAYEDHVLIDLVTHAFRNRVVDEMLKQETEVYESVTLDDILHMRNEEFVVNGAFRERFLAQFPSETLLIDPNRLKPNRLDEKSIDIMNEELDKISDKEKVQKFKFRTYLESMRNRKCWAGPLEIKAIEKLIEREISVISDESANYSLINNNKNIFLFLTNQIHYNFGLVKPEVVIKAIKSANYKLASRLIKVGVADVNYQDDVGWTLMHYVITTDNYKDLIRHLFNQGANLGIKNKDDKTGLELARFLDQHKSIETITSLSNSKEIDREPSIQFMDRNDPNSSLLKAKLGEIQVENETYEIYEGPSDLVLKTGSEFASAIKGRDLTKTRFLIQLGAKVNENVIEEDDVTNYVTPLHYAAQKGYLDLTKVLVVDGRAEVNVRDGLERTPLQRAVELGHFSLVKFLIDHGAEVNSAVMTSGVMADHDHIVDYLVVKGAEVNAIDRNRMCPLHHAVRNGQWNMVTCLVERGARLDVTNGDGETPLSIAIERGNWAIAKYLLENGAQLVGLSEKIKGEIYERFIAQFKSDFQLHHAIALGNAELLETLLTSALISNAKLFEVYNELKVQSSRLNLDICIFIENKLMDVNYYSNYKLTNEPIKETLNIDNVKKRLRLLIECIDRLLIDCEDEEASDSFVFIGKFVAKNMQILKRDLSVTRDVIAWEETQFCLINFLFRFVRPSEIDVIASLVLRKKRILAHLSLFKSQLSELDLDKLDFSRKLIKERGLIRANLMTSLPEVKDLLEDFERLRDLRSLTKVDFHLRVACAVDLKRKPEVGRLVIERALQVTGECLKSTIDSPNLSDRMQIKLIDFAPIRTKKLVTALRDDLSHVVTLNERCKLEKNASANHFRKIRNDLSKLKSEIAIILIGLKIDIIKSFFDKIIDCENINDARAIVTSALVIDSENAIIDGDEAIIDVDDENNRVIDKIASYLSELRKVTGELSETQELHLSECDVILEEMRAKSGMARNYYAMLLEEVKSMLRLIDSKRSLESVREGARVVLSRYALSDVDRNSFVTQIVFLVQNVEYAFPRFPQNANALIIKLLRAIRYEARQIENIDRFKENLSEKSEIDFDVLKSIDDQFFDFLRKVSDDKLSIKISDEFETKKEIYRAKHRLIDFYKQKPFLNTIDKAEFNRSMKIIDFRLLKKDNESFDSLYEENDRLKCKLMINRLNQRTNDSYGKFVAIFIDKSEIDFDNIVTSFLSTFKSAKKLTLNFEGKNKRVNFSIKKYFFQNLRVLERIIDLEKRDSQIIDLLKSDSELRLSVEMLTLTLMEIMESISLFENNSKFLDQNFQVLIGKNLRNYLAHGDLLIDLLSIDHLKSIVHHVRNIQNNCSKTESIIYNGDNRIGKNNIENIDALKIDYEKNLSLIKKQESSIIDIKNIDLSNIGNSWTLQLRAAQIDHLKHFKVVLKDHLNIYYRDKFGHSILFYLVKFNSKSILDYVIDRCNINPNIVLSKRKSMLHLSAEFGHSDLTEWLLSIGVSVNDSDGYGLTALQYAANNGHDSIVQSLIKSGAALIVSEQEETIMSQLKSIIGNIDIVQKLIDSMPSYFKKVLLHLACKFGQSNIVRLLIDYGVDVNLANKEGATALHVTALSSDVESLRVLLDSDADVTRLTNDGDSVLHRASLKNSVEIVRALLDRGCDVNAVTNHGASPLHLACLTGNYEIAELLLSYGAEVNFVTDDRSALHHAAAGNFTKTVKTLLERHADPNISAKDGKLALHIASYLGNVKIMNALIEHGSQINFKDLNGDVALHYAIFNNKINAVELLMRHGCDLNVSSVTGSTPLHVASATGHCEILKMLMESDAEFKVNVTLDTPLHVAALYGHDEVTQALIKKYNVTEDVDVDERTALHFAARSGNAKTVDVLLKRKSNVNALDNNNRTPLHYAVQEGHYAIVQKLLEGNAKSDVQSNNGYSPLHTAANKGYASIVKLLLKSNRNAIDFRTYKGVTALHLASSNNFFQPVKSLLENGADVNAKLGDGVTALHLAMRMGSRKLVEILLDHGADVNSVTDEGFSCLHYAIIKGHSDVFELLLKRGALINENETPPFFSLLLATQHARHTIVTRLLRDGADVNAVIDGYTPLRVAVEHGHATVTEILLKNGAKLDVTHGNGMTGLHYAVISGRHEIIKVLRKHGADVNARDAFRYTPLHGAARKGHAKCVTYLLVFGADALALAESGSTALHYAVIDGHRHVVTALINHQKNSDLLNRTDVKGRTALYVSVLKSDVEIASVLVTSGADVNIPTLNTVTPLHLAIMMGNFDMVKLLLTSGSDVNLRMNSQLKVFSDAVSSRDSFSITCVHLAVQYNNPKAKQRFVSVDEGNSVTGSDDRWRLDNPNAILCGVGSDDPLLKSAVHDERVLQLILDATESGSDVVNAGDSEGDAPLVWAIRDGNVNATLALLRHVLLDVNRANFKGWSALHFAVIEGQRDVIDLLLTSGADVNAKNHSDVTPLEMAAHVGGAETVRALLKRGASAFHKNRVCSVLHRAVRFDSVLKLILEEMKSDRERLGAAINEGDANGDTPLMWAVEQRKLSAAELLLESGVIDVNKQNDKGWSALHFAVSGSDVRVVEALIDRGADPFAMNDHESALHLAVKSDDILKLIVRAMKSDRERLRAAMNQSDGEGDTPLMWAVEQRRLSAAELLLESGDIDINKQNDKGWSALHWSAHVGQLEIVSLLINNKADANVRDENGETAFDIANKNVSLDEKYEIVAALLLSVTDVT